MELRDYLRVIRRRWMLIVASVLVVVGVAAAVTYNTTPLYESKSRLFVSTSDQETSTAYQGGLFSIQRVASYADLVNGRELSQRVIDELGLDVEPEELSEKPHRHGGARDGDPRDHRHRPRPGPRPADLPGGRAGAHRVRRRARDAAGPRQRPDQGDASSTPPTCPRRRSRRSRCATSASAVVLGLLLGLGIAVMRELLDTSVKGAARPRRDHRRPRCSAASSSTARPRSGRCSPSWTRTARGSRRSGSCAPTCSSSTSTRPSKVMVVHQLGARRGQDQHRDATSRWRCTRPARRSC